MGVQRTTAEMVDSTAQDGRSLPTENVGGPPLPLEQRRAAALPARPLGVPPKPVEVFWQ